MLWEWGTIRILSKIDSHLWSYISFLPVYLRPLQNNVTKKTTVYIESDTKYQCKSRAPVRLYETLGISSVYVILGLTAPLGRSNKAFQQQLVHKLCTSLLRPHRS